MMISATYICPIRGLAGVTWLSLIDLEPRIYTQPPSALEHVGLLNQGLEPKEWAEPLLKEICTIDIRYEDNNFIDLSPEEYLVDPQTHLFRLWEHFPKPD